MQTVHTVHTDTHIVSLAMSVCLWEGVLPRFSPLSTDVAAGAVSSLTDHTDQRTSAVRIHNCKHLPHSWLRKQGSFPFPPSGSIKYKGCDYEVIRAEKDGKK
jgi:hypothetical protein